jgi:hypothetical protein
MRGGNRQRPVAAPGARVPPPPADLSERERRIWRELADAVERIGTFQPSDALYFRLTVKTLAQAEAPESMAPTARARVLKAAGAMLSGWGLSPLSRERVKVPPPPPPQDELSEFTDRVR